MLAPFDSEQHDREIRTAVEKGLGHFANDSDWDRWVGTLSDKIQRARSVNEAAGIFVREYRALQSSRPRLGPDSTPRRPGSDSVAQPLEAPPYWKRHARQVLQAWDGVQREVLDVFRLDEPASLSEQSALIASHLRLQHGDLGDSELTLEFAAEIGPGPRRLVSRPVFMGDSPATGTWPSHATPSGRAEVHALPLFLLAYQAQRLSWETGCEPYQAVDFLLSDVSFDVPWVVSRPRKRSAVIDIRLASPAALNRDVLAAVRAARRWQRETQPEMIATGPRRRRRARQDPKILLEFVKAHAPHTGDRRDWGHLRELWGQEYPDRHQYLSPRAMYESHRRAANRARSGEDG